MLVSQDLIRDAVMSHCGQFTIGSTCKCKHSSVVTRDKLLCTIHPCWKAKTSSEKMEKDEIPADLALSAQCLIQGKRSPRKKWPMCEMINWRVMFGAVTSPIVGSLVPVKSELLLDITVL